MNSIRSEQIRDGEVRREDIDVSTAGQALITKVIAGKAITFASSTGIDAGTGDVTLDFGDSTDLFYDDTNKRIGMGTNTPGSIIDIVLPSASVVGHTIKAAASQTANLLEFKNSSDVVQAHITPEGRFNDTGGGTNSLVIGEGANVDGDEIDSVAVGKNASCLGDDSVAVGYQSTAGGSGSTAQRNCTAIGSGATATQSSAVAIGTDANTNNTSGSTAIGYSSSVTGNSSVAIGSGASCTGAFGVAIGQGTTNTGSGVTIGKDAAGSFALGYNADSSGHANAMALGTTSFASQTYSMALGKQANSSHTGSICIGFSANSTANNQLIIGSDDTTSARITDVYIGEGVTNASPDNTTYHASGGSGTDIAGADLIFAGGKGTGSAAGGEIIFQTSDAGSSGTTLQTLTTKLKIDVDGQLVTNLDPNTGDYFATSTNKLGLEATNEIWLNTPLINLPQAVTWQSPAGFDFTVGNNTFVISPLTGSFTFKNNEATFSSNRIRFRDDISSNAANDETAKFDLFPYTGTTTISGTIAEVYTARFGAQTLTHATTATTFTQASTLMIESAPVASTNVTITEALALYVKSGNTKLDGNLSIGDVIASARIHIDEADPATNPYMKFTHTGIQTWQLYGTGTNDADLTFKLGSTDLLTLDNAERVGIGTISPSCKLHVYDSSAAGDMLQVEGLPQTDGSNPVTLVLKSRRSGTWTDDAPYANIDFYSKDSSGAGAGVKARISAYNDATTGGGVGLKFYTDPGTGLVPAMRFDKDNRMQLGNDSQTGIGRMNSFTAAISQHAYYGMMMSGYTGQPILIEDSSFNDLFEFDNSNNLYLRSGILKFDDNKTTGSGEVTLTMSSTSVAVTFDNAMNDDEYVVNTEVSWQTSVWITNKTASGFTINVGTPDATYDKTICWSIRPK